MVYSTTDAAAASPLIRDFQALYPGIRVDYSDLNSTELYNRFIAEVAAGSTGDVLWSSAMDLQLKLAAEGHARHIPLPKSRRCRTGRCGRTRLTARPTSRSRLSTTNGSSPPPRCRRIIRRCSPFSPTSRRLPGKVTAYDPEKSGVGFLFVNEDVKYFPQAWDLFRAFGKVGVRLYPRRAP